MAVQVEVVVHPSEEVVVHPYEEVVEAAGVEAHPPKKLRQGVEVVGAPQMVEDHAEGGQREAGEHRRPLDEREEVVQ